MEDFIVTTLHTYGFPAAMCFYLIVRTTRAIDNNTAALRSLRAQLVRMHKLEDNSDDEDSNDA